MDGNGSNKRDHPKEKEDGVRKKGSEHGDHYTLQNQHGIAKTKETITFLDSFSVGFPQEGSGKGGKRVLCIRSAHKSRDQHKQGRARQVKVGKESVGGAETVGGIHKNGSRECAWGKRRVIG
ncbi:MAG: hypothetical protein UX38_C0004G0051 [Microgenomates group bacterium GW2011_GWC1_46_16]|nr:MAG: hypothetical protein UX38_C0004G0051 [Microgenomates group bacterium GW2011_GWC1_46_16]